MNALCLFRRTVILLPLVLLVFPSAGCRKSRPEEAGGPAVPSGPQAVTVQTVKPERFVVKSSQPGRLGAWRQAEVRARVPGIILSRPYEEGQEVKAGTVLFQIDPAPFKAELDSAAAALQEAEAALALAEDRKERIAGLVNTRAVSAFDLKEAESTEKQAAARISAAKAAVDTARLRQDYATVTSPIDGRARRAEVTEGALVGEDTATLLTIVEQLDPIYVNFSQPLAEVTTLRRAAGQGSVEGVSQEEIKVRLELTDGTAYPQPGKLIFSDLAVDPGTDTVQLRAVIPNPERRLFPGMFVRVVMDVAVEPQAILVPREAVLRSAGGASVMAVNDKNEVSAIPVEAREIEGGRWHITSGLKGGERLVVENPAFVPPGSVVVPEEKPPVP